MAKRKITELTELTTPASVDFLHIVDNSEALDINKNKRITVGNLLSGTSPLTSKGDIFIHDGVSDLRLPVGLDNQILIANSAESAGLQWITADLGEPYVTINSAGAFPTAVGSEAIAIGGDTNATGNTSIAIGSVANANANDSIAIGNDTIADNTDAIALGDGAECYAEDAIAIGEGAYVAALSPLAIAFGDSAQIDDNANSSIAIGNNSRVYLGSFNSIAFGNGVETGSAATAASSSTTIGNGTTNLGISTTALGSSHSILSGGNSTSVLGNFNTVNANHSEGILIGNSCRLLNSTGTDIRNIAIGFSIDIQGGQDNILIGNNPRTNPSGGFSGNIVLGHGVLHQAEGNNTVVIGSEITVASDDSIAIGSSADVDVLAPNSIAIGNTAGIGMNANDSVQFGTGTNNEASTLQYLTNRLANAEGLYTSYTSPTNYSPADDDNITSHLTAIDTALGSFIQGNPYFVTNQSGVLPTTTGTDGIAVGENSVAAGVEAIVIGKDSTAGVNLALEGIVIGNSSSGTGTSSISIGSSIGNISNDAIAIGNSISINTNSNNSISIGNNSQVTINANDGVAIGANAVSSNVGAVQIGIGTNSNASTLQFLTVPIANPRVVTPLQAELEVAVNTVATVGSVLPVDVSTVAVIVTPPAGPIALDTFSVSDSRANAATNNITVDFIGAGDNFHGTATNHVINTDRGYAKFLYINSTIGWILTN